jgi:hypothetical protein
MEAPETSGGPVPAFDRLLKILRQGVARPHIVDGATRLGRGRNDIHDRDLEPIRCEVGRRQSGVQRDNLSVAVGQKMLVHALVDQRIVGDIVCAPDLVAYQPKGPRNHHELSPEIVQNVWRRIL